MGWDFGELICDWKYEDTWNYNRKGNFLKNINQLLLRSDYFKTNRWSTCLFRRCLYLWWKCTFLFKKRPTKVSNRFLMKWEHQKFSWTFVFIITILDKTIRKLFNSYQVDKISQWKILTNNNTLNYCKAFFI